MLNAIQCSRARTGGRAAAMSTSKSSGSDEQHPKDSRFVKVDPNRMLHTISCTPRWGDASCF